MVQTSSSCPPFPLLRWEGKCRPLAWSAVGLPTAKDGEPSETYCQRQFVWSRDGELSPSPRRPFALVTGGGLKKTSAEGLPTRSLLKQSPRLERVRRGDLGEQRRRGVAADEVEAVVRERVVHDRVQLQRAHLDPRAQCHRER